MSKKEEIIKQRAALLKKLEEGEAQDRLKISEKKSAAAPSSRLLASSSRAEAAPSSTGISARGDTVSSRVVASRAARATSPLSTSSRLLAEPSSSRAARGAPASSRLLAESAAGVEPRALSPRSLHFEDSESVVTSRAVPRRKASEEEYEIPVNKGRRYIPDQRPVVESSQKVSSRYIPPAEIVPEKKPGFSLLSFFSSKKKDLPAEPPKTASITDMMFATSQKNPSASNLEQLPGQSHRGKTALKSLDAESSAAAVRSPRGRSGSRSRNDAESYFPFAEQPTLGSNSAQLAQKAPSDRHFAFDDESGSRVQPRSNLRNSQEQLANNFEVPDPPPSRRSLSNSRIEPKENIQGSAMASPSSSMRSSGRSVVELPRTLKSSLKLSLKSSVKSSVRSIYEYNCDEDDMEIINRLSELVSELVEPDYVPVYLHKKQSESGLEGKKFIDFLQQLSFTPRMPYQKYVQDYEDANEDEIRRQIRTMPEGDQTFFEELHVYFPLIPDQDITETLLTNPQATRDEIIAILKKIPKELERESNHSFKEEIRAAIKQNLIKVADDGNCFFESISTGLNLLSGEKKDKYTAESVREQISNAEFYHFGSKLFRLPIMSYPNGFGVFSEWTVPELVDLNASIADEKKRGLKTGLDEKTLNELIFPHNMQLGPKDEYQVQIVEHHREDNGALEHVFAFKTPQEYAVLMGEDGVHGTKVELMVAALMYKVTIVVYIANIEQFHYFFPNIEECRNGRIIYLFKANEMGHFDVVNLPRGMFSGFDVYGLPTASYISDSCLREQGQSAAVANLDEQPTRRQKEFAETAPVATATEEYRQKLYKLLMSKGKEGITKEDGTLPIVSYTDLEQMFKGKGVEKVKYMRYYIKLGVFLGLVPQQREDKSYEEYLLGNDRKFIDLYEHVLPVFDEYNQWVTGQRQPMRAMLASGAATPALAAAEQIKDTRVQSSEQPMRVMLASEAATPALAAAELNPLVPLVPSLQQKKLQAYTLKRTTSSPANMPFLSDVDASNDARLRAIVPSLSSSVVENRQEADRRSGTAGIEINDSDLQETLQSRIKELRDVLIPNTQQMLNEENGLFKFSIFGMGNRNENTVDRLRSTLEEYERELTQLTRRKNGGKMTTRKTRQRRGKNAKMTARRRKN